MYDICITNNGVVPMTRCGDRPVDPSDIASYFWFFT